MDKKSNNKSHKKKQKSCQRQVELQIEKSRNLVEGLRKHLNGIAL